MSEIISNDNGEIFDRHTADGAYRHLCCWLTKNGAPSDIFQDASMIASNLAAVTKERDEAQDALKEAIEAAEEFAVCRDITSWRNAAGLEDNNGNCS